MQSNIRYYLRVCTHCGKSVRCSRVINTQFRTGLNGNREDSRSVLPAEVTPACVWMEGNNIGAVIYSFNLNISPKMLYGVLECDSVVLQNYMLMVL